MALSRSSPVIENCQCQGRESVSDAISMIEVLWLRQCTHYVDDLLPYEPLCSCWARGQVVWQSKRDKIIKIQTQGTKVESYIFQGAKGQACKFKELVLISTRAL